MGRPTVGAAVPCRPHGIGRGDRENVERGFRQDLQDGQDWGDAVHDLPARAPEPFAAENAAVRARAWDQWRREVRRAYAALPPDEKALAQALKRGESQKYFGQRHGWSRRKLICVLRRLRANFRDLWQNKPPRPETDFPAF